MEQRTYRMVFFDLDGTLLPMDLDEFLGSYFKRLIGFAATQGYDPKLFQKALMDGTNAMIELDGQPNDQVFWRVFSQVYGLSPQEAAKAEEVFAQFYTTQFCAIGADVAPSEPMVCAVKTLAEKGYPLVLATQPLFPRMATEERMRWAGLDASMFAHVTTYENSTSAKPKLDYYREVLAAVGAQPEDVLMVGNNTHEDLSSMALGLDGYLVTDFLLNPIDYDISQVKHGGGQEFLAWVRDLPPYEG